MDDLELIDAESLVSLAELCRCCGVESAWVAELEAHGIVAPAAGSAAYPGLAILRLRKARRLQKDFNLNAPGLALALDLLDEIDRLRARLARAGIA